MLTDIGLTWDSGTYTFVADVIMPMEQAKSDSLFVDGSITSEDKAAADKGQEVVLNFYRRVFKK